MSIFWFVYYASQFKCFWKNLELDNHIFLEICIVLFFQRLDINIKDKFLFWYIKRDQGKYLAYQLFKFF